jgi:predicted DNA-binding transcriptional regulator AlpA
LHSAVPTGFDDGFLSIDEFCELAGRISRGTYYREASRGTMPAPQKITAQRVGILRSEAKKWLVRRASAASSIGVSAVAKGQG